MIESRAPRLLTYAPAILLGASALLLVIPGTRRVALWLLAEDRPVEDLTSIAFVAASVIAARVAWKHGTGAGWWICGVYGLLAIAFLAIAMEELSWGQRRLGFETPEMLRRVNRQGEVTLHNIGALQGRSEWMRLCAGLLGLLAGAARRIPALNHLSAPTVLRSWFLVITGHALIDVFNDLVPIDERVDFVVQRTSEMVELLIGLAALLYAWLNLRRFTGAFQNDLKVSPR